MQNKMSLDSRQPKKKSCSDGSAVVFLSAMIRKHRFFLLALFLATLAFSSCMNQEGVGPADGELKTPGGAGGN
jgi:hypothetical protein